MSVREDKPPRDPSPIRAAVSFLLFATGGAILARVQGGLSWTRALTIVAPLTGGLGVLSFGLRELIALFKLAPGMLDSTLGLASRAIDFARRLSNSTLDTSQSLLSLSRRGTNRVKALLDAIANWIDPSKGGGPGTTAIPSR